MYTMKHIEELLERYFEGQTSAEEERTLRHFFTSDDVPESLMMYKPLFAYFDNEIKKADTISADAPDTATDALSGGMITAQVQPPEKSLFDKGEKTPGKRRNLMLWLSGAAACAALLIGAFFFTPRQPKCTGTGNYVIIDGRCYTDTETVRSAALQSLQEMTSDNIENLSEKTPDKAANIIEDQLKEFNSLFDDK